MDNVKVNKGLCCSSIAIFAGIFFLTFSGKAGSLGKVLEKSERASFQVFPNVFTAKHYLSLEERDEDESIVGFIPYFKPCFVQEC